MTIEDVVKEVWDRISGRAVTGDCGPASFALCARLREEGHSDARFVTGAFNGIYGGHCWVEIGDSIYDLTVQQFQIHGEFKFHIDDPRYVRDSKNTDPRRSIDRSTRWMSVAEVWLSSTKLFAYLYCGHGTLDPERHVDYYICDTCKTKTENQASGLCPACKAYLPFCQIETHTEQQGLSK